MTLASSTNNQRRETLLAMLAIGFISCSMLMWEILLTRICSLRLFFHFGYLIISNCLLGLGASGTMIFLFQEPWQRRKQLWISLATVCYLLSLAGAYLFVMKTYLPMSTKFSDPDGLMRFFLFNAVAGLPFFFAGGAVGMLLSFHGAGVNKIYFADLLGAGIGCLISPLLLKGFGAGGCLIVLAIWALIALAIYWPAPSRKMAAAVVALLIIIGLFALPGFDKKYPLPGKESLDFTKKLVLNVEKNKFYSKWSINSRIDVTRVDQRVICGLGDKRDHLPPVPEQVFIGQDGSAGTWCTNFSQHPEALALIENSLYSATLRLKPSPRVFIIGVGGGNDVWAAKVNKASYVKAIELNAGILDVHYQVRPEFSRLIIEDPNIHLINDEGRSALVNDQGKYDVIQMSGIDTWAALASGAYVLAENYLYTQEAILGMYDRLEPGGMLQITRMSADMEALRMVANINAALKRRGVTDVSPSLMCLRTSADQLMCAMVKKGEFTPEEVQSTSAFADLNGIFPVYLPGRSFDNLVEKFILDQNKEQFIEDFPRNITPTTDDKPYFFNFSKWRNPLKTKAYVSEPSHVSQGNPFFIILQLGISFSLSLVLVILPLTLFKRSEMNWAGRGPALTYFAALGLGFIGIEIAAIQKLTLFLGLPIYSLTVSLASLLIFTGLGSLLSDKLFNTLAHRRRVWVVPAAIIVLLAVFILFSQKFITLFFGQPIAVRIVLAAVALAPLGLVLGVPFAFGVRRLNDINPQLIPWGWAINGCCTVMGSITTVIFSMNFGFYAVLALSGLIYLVGFTAFSRLMPGDEEKEKLVEEKSVVGAQVSVSTK